MITPETLGSEEFRQDYGLRRAYVAGAMVKGIASAAMVVRMGRAGCLAFLGSGGLGFDEIEAALVHIKEELGNGEPFGVNMLANPAQAHREMAMVDLLLRHGVRNIEASAYMQLSEALVRFRLTGLRRAASGRLEAPNRLIAKISRPETAALFLAPPPADMVERLRQAGHLTEDEAALAGDLPMASDLCVEADSAGHTDMGVTAVLLPAIIRQRDRAQAERGYGAPVRVGSAGGIGSPEAAASAFLLGADFIVTGSINQCTVEAGTSDAVKDALQALGVQDTAYTVAGDLFELGGHIQVMKKGVFFPARASRLHDLWRGHASLDQIDSATRREIQDKFFRRSFDEVYAETRDHYLRDAPAEIERAERNPKAKMALVFRWYFVHSMRAALAGSRELRVDWQVHAGPAQGAFNQWVRGTALEDWRNRHVDAVADQLMQGCAEYLGRRLTALLPAGRASARD